MVGYAEKYRASIVIMSLQISRGEYTLFLPIFLLDFVPEAPIYEFDGFRIKKGRIFEGKNLQCQN